MHHTPVLLHEVLQFLDPQPGEFIVDGTADGGGHLAELAKRVLPNGTVLGIEWDRTMVAHLKKQFAGYAHVRCAQGNYADLPNILRKHRTGKADGLLLDLGFSSEQLETSGRGFSFRKDEPLLMTYDDTHISAYELLRKADAETLTNYLKTYGEERYALRIARAIKQTMQHQPIETTGALARVIRNAVPTSYEHGRIDPATRTFQALRIVVNDELGNLSRLLAALPLALTTGGRVAIISFHSLEDRLVKQAFRRLEREGILTVLTPRPIRADVTEVRVNPRSRSAKLRAACLK